MPQHNVDSSQHDGACSTCNHLETCLTVPAYCLTGLLLCYRTNDRNHLKYNLASAAMLPMPITKYKAL